MSSGQCKDRVNPGLSVLIKRLKMVVPEGLRDTLIKGTLKSVGSSVQVPTSCSLCFSRCCCLSFLSKEDIWPKATMAWNSRIGVMTKMKRYDIHTTVACGSCVAIIIDIWSGYTKSFFLHLMLHLKLCRWDFSASNYYGCSVINTGIVIEIKITC